MWTPLEPCCSVIAAVGVGVPERPGTLRWGRDQGCSFVVGSGAQWSPEYICGTDGELGCTPDHRMIAMCVVRTAWR
jgi:hypothetical protein